MRTSTHRARAIVAVLAASLALVTVVGPATTATPQLVTTNPQWVTIVSNMTQIGYPAGYNSGTFSTSGSGLICQSGTVLDTRYVNGPTPPNGGSELLVDKTFTCLKGASGTIFFELFVRGYTGGETFAWVIQGGTGAYARLSGLGVGSTTPIVGGVRNTYTGYITATPAGLGVNSFDATFSAMTQLTPLTATGKGMVGVILPDTSSTRYVSFDAPYLTQAFTAAGYALRQFKIDNAQGSGATEVALARADIASGAKVLIVDPLDGPTGNSIQTLAAANHVAYISYDRPTFHGTNAYLVSFDNIQVGKLIGQRFMDCVTAWNVASPQVFELDGGKDTDPNAISFAAGYNNVVWGTALTNTGQIANGTTNSAGYTLVGDQIAPGWDNTKGQTIFQTAFTANPKINATVEANDDLANAVITVLKGAGVGPLTIPTTGQDATLQAMVNILQGYQCGTVYKPVWSEAQAAVALATYLRAGQKPPAALVNGTTTDPTNAAVTEPAVLLPGFWVNGSNMESTVIEDKWVSATDLCNAVGAAVCTAVGIK
jgi:D-xylose transport system substrate-binding protein